MLFRQLAMTILDQSQSRTFSINLVDNPYYGSPNEDNCKLCTKNSKDSTTTRHCDLTVYVVSNRKSVTLTFAHVHSDEKETGALNGASNRVAAHPFNIDLLLAD